MSYKLKSLVYFASFLTSIFAYYALDSEGQFNNNNTNEEIAELKADPISLDQPKILK
ncbi:MAG: hypothetical protein KJO52_11215 [Maribacter sp.]|nr:hypothetical protein [Maribacter sp.]